MFLICELNDEDYTEPVFRVCETKEKAFEESMKRLDDLAKKEGSELKVSYHGNRTRIDWQLKDWFVVVENLPFNESFEIICWYGTMHTMVLIFRFLDKEHMKNV